MEEIRRPDPKTKTPKDAKRVFKGVLFDVYQWEQEMFDGSTETFEIIKRADSVGVIPVTKEKEILITKQVHPALAPFCCTFGGRMDPGETPLETAKREMLEESGYEAEEFKLIRAIQPENKVDRAVYVFAALNAVKVADQNLESGEKIEIMKVDFDGFIKAATQDNFRARETSEMAFKALSDAKYKEELKQKLGL